MQDQGAGAGTVLRQIVADELQVDWQAIALETLDTAKRSRGYRRRREPRYENLWERML